MDFDIRIPIGLLFLIIGGMLTTYGVVAPSESVGLNINAIWGGVMALFGVGMLVLSFASAKRG